MALESYRRKRDFAATPEPEGRKGRARKTDLRFVVQKHGATRLHYDLRLELDGVLKSWAVTRGPSLDPADKRLAVETEDHPLEYAGFEGVIPKGQYGAGRSIIWDRGIWIPEGDARAGLAKGHLAFTLNGAKLSGLWHLVRMKDRPGEKPGRLNWLLTKADDGAARPGADILGERPESVASGLTVEQLGETPPPPAAPLPDFLPPMLAETALSPPAGDRWLHEVKLDGYRLQARLDDGRLRLLTRSGLDWTGRFAGPLTHALAALPCKAALIDGEVVVETETGISSFSALQADLSAGRVDRLVFWAFDLLHLDGRDMTVLPLDNRRAALRGLIRSGDRLRLSESFDMEGARVLHHACRLGLEGIMSKDRSAPYTSGRSRSWVKSKCVGRGEFVIGGFVLSAARRDAIGSLVLGAWQDGRLRPVGRVGSGFSVAAARSLYRQLSGMTVAQPVFDPPLTGPAASGVVPVRPELVAEVEYRAVTADGNLRHAVFRGLREDKPAAEVLFDLQSATTSARAITVKLTNPDRALWPDLGLTKQDLADYYAAAWPLMAPHITARPLAILRAPDGLAGKTFFQKHHLPGQDDNLTEMRDPRRSASPPLIVVNDLDGLIALAQISALEIHPWGAPAANPQQPDRLILDLDPGEGVDWPQVITAAQDVAEACRQSGLVPFVKTSGGKGLHIVCPLTPGLNWDDVSLWTRALARAFAAEEPDRFTATAGEAHRKGRIFIDYLRNRMGQTAVAPYSPRARPAAGVSTPLSWEELPSLTGPTQFNLTNIAARLEGTADPWAEFALSGRRLEI